MDDIISKYSRSKDKVPKEIAMLGIMETYGWTYQEYLDTPAWIIDLIHGKNEIDFRKSRLKNGNK